MTPLELESKIKMDQARQKANTRCINRPVLGGTKIINGELITHTMDFRKSIEPEITKISEEDDTYFSGLPQIFSKHSTNYKFV